MREMKILMIILICLGALIILGTSVLSGIAAVLAFATGVEKGLLLLLLCLVGMLFTIGILDLALYLMRGLFDDFEGVS